MPFVTIFKITPTQGVRGEYGRETIAPHSGSPPIDLDQRRLRKDRHAFKLQARPHIVSC